MARHFSISVILCSQEDKLIPAPIRKLSFYNIFFRINNSKERNDMLNENYGFLDEHEFERVYNYATRDRYNFIFCMVKERKFLKIFEKVIATEKDGILI